MKRKYFIFDLDDTLTSEFEYLKSAYRLISSQLNGSDDLFEEMLLDYKAKKDVFASVSSKFNIPKEELLETYRFHSPEIGLKHGAIEILEKIKNAGFQLGLITDGRSKTQRNKIKALGIEHYFDKIIISEEIGSEKPSEANFKVFETDFIGEFYYIADNPKKDFITPNKLGWMTVCLLDSGENIHKQNFDLDEEYLPKIKISNLLEIEKLI